jgi:hypothetical protein
MTDWENVLALKKQKHIRLNYLPSLLMPSTFLPSLYFHNYSTHLCCRPA